MLVNFVLFQIGWFACVLGGAWGHPWWGPAFLPLVLLAYIASARRRPAAWLLVLAVTVLGYACDFAVAKLGAVVFHENDILIGPVPIWMLALWAMFATTLDVSMGWLKSKLLLATVLGAILGPMAYLGGERLGALSIAEQASGLPGFVWVAIQWAFAMAVCASLAKVLAPSQPALKQTEASGETA